MLATIDRSDALYHVPVERLHRRFLAFRYQGITYWTCLQFSLAFAPQAFSQLTNWVASFSAQSGCSNYCLLCLEAARAMQPQYHRQLGRLWIGVFNTWEMDGPKHILNTLLRSCNP
uniref:Uncharacterized protein n=1 Tax=Cacopsylla melanoneura TaxID=428564 RepID=A0A8D8Q6N3_9HEMI